MLQEARPCGVLLIVMGLQRGPGVQPSRQKPGDRGPTARLLRHDPGWAWTGPPRQRQDLQDTKDQLVTAIQERTAPVGVIGQGYVGLPLFGEAGFRVTGFDVDPSKAAAISRGESYIKHIGPERVTMAVRSGRHRATSGFDGLLQEGGADVAYCDPLFTASRKGRKHDLAMRSVPGCRRGDVDAVCASVSGAGTRQEPDQRSTALDAHGSMGYNALVVADGGGAKPVADLDLTALEDRPEPVNAHGRARTASAERPSLEHAWISGTAHRMRWSWRPMGCGAQPSSAGPAQRRPVPMVPRCNAGGR